MTRCRGSQRGVDLSDEFLEPLVQLARGADRVELFEQLKVALLEVRRLRAP
jgi:hypothetical protein